MSHHTREICACYALTYLHAQHHLDTELNCVYTERESQSLIRLYLPKIPNIPTEVVAVRLREDPTEDFENTSQKKIKLFFISHVKVHCCSIPPLIQTVEPPAPSCVLVCLEKRAYFWKK